MSRNFLISISLSLGFILTACSPTAPTAAPIAVAEATQAPQATPTQQASVAAPESGVLDACTLITQAEAEQVLGTSTGSGQHEDTPPFYSCSYETENFDLVQVVVVIYDDNAQAQDAYQMAIDINGYPELAGLGDRAYNAQPIFDVNVLTGNIEVSIDVSDSTNDATQLKNAIDLAKLVLSRLQ